MRLIDADELKHRMETVEMFGLKGLMKVAIGMVIVSPIVDAVEVVRCKDCYYCFTVKSFGKEYLYCDAFCEHAEGDLIGVSLMVEPNHYCSWGERREDETD